MTFRTCKSIYISCFHIKDMIEGKELPSWEEFSKETVTYTYALTARRLHLKDGSKGTIELIEFLGAKERLPNRFAPAYKARADKIGGVFFLSKENARVLRNLGVRGYEDTVGKYEFVVSKHGKSRLSIELSRKIK